MLDWENFVAHQYGSRFSDIDDAKHTPKMTCELSAGGNTKCTVVAMPCDD